MVALKPRLSRMSQKKFTVDLMKRAAPELFDLRFPVEPVQRVYAMEEMSPTRNVDRLLSKELAAVECRGLEKVPWGALADIRARQMWEHNGK